MRVSAGHAPDAAAASEQRGTPLSVASRPGGSATFTPARNSCPSGRVNAAVNAPEPPAVASDTVAPNAGANAGPVQPVTVTDAGVDTAGVPDHGRYTASPPALPQPR